MGPDGSGVAPFLSGGRELWQDDGAVGTNDGAGKRYIPLFSPLKELASLELKVFSHIVSWRCGW